MLMDGLCRGYGGVWLVGTKMATATITGYSRDGWFGFYNLITSVSSSGASVFVMFFVIVGMYIKFKVFLGCVISTDKF